MLLFTILLRRTRRVMICMRRAAINALAFSAATMLLVLISYTTFKGEPLFSVSTALLLMLAVMGSAFVVFFFVEVGKYGKKIFHRYDEDMIGGAFTGLGKKSQRFESGLWTLHSGDFEAALNIFTELDASDIECSREEQGVLSFYRGRCYQIMGMYPNAVVNYEKAEEFGYSLPELPLFKARSCAATGATNKAIEILKGIMDTDHKYSCRARYEIGSVYIKLNDGENALKWFNEAIERRECYADALGGAALAYTIMRDLHKGEEYFRMALINNIEDPHGFTTYFKKVQAAVMLESHPGKEDTITHNA
ncbi:MAG: tetratricopeptide repeat protein [Ruminococcus sp.]|nr:tetratricopeptide repeat protein [Ruminococcus sp.]